MTHRLVVVRGAGDLATGCIVRLVRSGFPVVALEAAAPRAIRRTVCLSEAVYEGEAVVEGVRATCVDSLEELRKVLARPLTVPILVDPSAECLSALRPAALVDAILAKRNLGTRRGMAPVTIALGPGFRAGADVDAVVETNRGHDLGRVILDGPAQADTGVPGILGGHGAERVVRAPGPGEVKGLRAIGDRVSRGEPLFQVGDALVPSPLDGVLRGLLRDGFQAWQGLKSADVDPRGEVAHCFTISDKARSVAGGVLEALLALGAP